MAQSGSASHWQCEGQGFESPQLHETLGVLFSPFLGRNRAPLYFVGGAEPPRNPPTNLPVGGVSGGG
ncbi:hypothetical protein FRAAL1940 [Frankia alni ACN14a]|uniref:Uncharacterized protein n=1 Tax=Frankia alni (strain DSM 45986 / CECT 9034 / ACN14a) TaxID=326424 RepID=Q0RPE3_FRAAA|nr:hypothetical protein FRAAL1940 [Frankia alni ACN14a]